MSVRLYSARMTLTAPARQPRTTGRLRRLLQPLVAPPVFDFWASRLNRTWTWDRCVARVVGRSEASSDAVTLLLQPNRHFAGFVAGQHVNIAAEIDGIRYTRSYSFSSAPRADGRVEITVKAIEGGRLSRHLCADVRVGDVLDLGRAFGDMSLPALVGGRWLFLAAGSGITPLMAMVRELASRAMPVPLTLLYWARTREELCFVEELRAIAAAHPGFDLRFMVTRQHPQAADEAGGRIDVVSLDGLVTELETRQVFACGPGGFVETARAVLASKVVSFRAEAFTPPPRVVLDTGSVQVTLASSGRSFAVPRGQPLLDALEAEGLRPPHGCRMGICNTCSCAKQAGTTRHLHTGDTTDEPVSALKLCVSSAATDLVLDL